MNFIYVRTILISLLGYSGLFLFFYFFPSVFSAYGIFGEKLNLTYLIEKKAQYYIGHMQNKNLGVNFLLNQRILSTDERVYFQSSGLIHLLAVSGGQIIPICRVIGFSILRPAFLILQKPLSSTRLMKLLYALKTILFLCVSLLMTSLFACAGALVRVAFLYSLNEFLKSRQIFSILSQYMPCFSNHFIRRFFILICMSVCFGNVFFDYSFLLSSIGALSVELIAQLLNKIFYKVIRPQKLKSFIEPIILTFCASWLIALLFYPLCQAPLLMSGFANALASPIVTFFVTPLSLGLIFAPVDCFFVEWVLKYFDSFLGFLNVIAETFGQKDYSLNIANTLLFSLEGQIYLVLILISFLTVSDFLKARSETKVRYYFMQHRSIEQE